MFDSVLVDVAIGLVLMFFLLALAASSIVEAAAGILKIRSKGLEEGITALIDDPALVYETSVFAALSKSSGARKKTPRKPSYVSSRAFADAVVESITRIKGSVHTAEELADRLPENLRVRLDAISNEVGDDVVKIKARLEDWFDDAMDRVSGSFKRWSQIWLFVVGLVLTIAMNASAVHVAATLWQQPAARDAAVKVAKQVAEDSDANKVGTDVEDAADAVADLKASQLPLGWKNWDEPGGTIGTIGGWFLTAFLVLLGAPFWYGLLTKLVSLRSSGAPPPKAVNDPSSATQLDAERVRAGTAPVPAPTSLPSALSAGAFGPFAPAGGG